MKYLLLLVTLLSTVSHAEQLKLSIEGSLYYIDKNNEGKIEELYTYSKGYGGFNELHSSKTGRLMPGGEWNLEIRLNETNTANIKFWIKDKQNPEINKNIDVSELNAGVETLINDKKGELRLTLIPKLVNDDKLQPIQISQDNFGLNHFCLKNSALIINDNFYIGKLTGFGERVQLRMTEFYDIDFSLKPLRDWQQIGVYQDGIIKIDVDDKNILEMLSIGIGPSGYQKGGPFKVYGKIVKNNRSIQEHMQHAEKYKFKDVTPRIKNIIMNAKSINPYHIEGVTIGNDYNVGEYLHKAIGTVFTGFDCG